MGFPPPPTARLWFNWEAAPSDEATAVFAARLRGVEIEFGTVRFARRGFVDVAFDNDGGHVKAARLGWMNDGIRAMRTRRP